MKEKTKVLMIMAHPDDEVIWGWPILQRDDIEKHLLVVSTNQTKYGSGPINALKEVANETNSYLHYMPYSIETNFYRLPTRYESMTLMTVVRDIVDSIKRIIGRYCPNYLFTHNLWGEYGHGDHRLLSNIVLSLMPEDISVLITDICLFNKTHLSTDSLPSVYDKLLENLENYGDETLNMKWYQTMKSIYVEHGAWSWGQNNINKTCSIFVM